MPKHIGFVLNIYVNSYCFKLGFACQQIVNLPTKLLGPFKADGERLKRQLTKCKLPFGLFRSYFLGFLMLACAAARRAIGTRKGEQET